MTAELIWRNAHKTLLSLGYINCDLNMLRMYGHYDISTRFGWLCEQTSDIVTLLTHRGWCATHPLAATKRLRKYGYSEWFMAKILEDSDAGVRINARISLYLTTLSEYVGEMNAQLIVEYC